MRNRRGKRYCLAAITALFFLLATSPAVDAQQSFRQFDRKMVATPAELFEALARKTPSKKWRRRGIVQKADAGVRTAAGDAK